MGSEECIKLAAILNNYWNPISTQKYIDDFCKIEKITDKDIDDEYVAKFLLYFATRDVGGQHVKKQLNSVRDISSYLKKKKVK